MLDKDIINYLKKKLNTLIESTKSIHASLITEDGLIIITSGESEDKIDNISSFAAISSSILAMAESGIEIINKNKNLQQIKIDAEYKVKEDSYEDYVILITRILSNVLLKLIYPKKIKFGLIQYEVSLIINEIREILVKNGNLEIILSKVGSLL
ncbi:MAG: hypothetical protein ACTSVV_04965 [Promethearchaeota archaeon]